MYNQKALRTELYTVITRAVSAFNVPVSYAVNKDSPARYVVFDLQDLISYDERNGIELEVDIVGPASEIDVAEDISTAIIQALDHRVVIADAIGFYAFRSTRNRVDGSDPHTVRFRITFDLYLYERG